MTFGDISVTVNDIAYDYNTAPALTILMNDPLPAVVVSLAMLNQLMHGQLAMIIR